MASTGQQQQQLIAVPEQEFCPPSKTSKYGSELGMRSEAANSELAQRSVHSEEAVTLITKPRGVREVMMLTSRFRAVLPTFIFMLSVVIGGVHPLVYEWALWDPTVGAKVREFKGSTLYTAYYLNSFVVASVLSYGMFGMKGMKDTWNMKMLLRVAPTGIIVVAVETLDAYVLESIHGALRGVISQLRLPMLAVIGTVCLHRKKTLLQWMLILAVTASVMGYSLVSVKEIGLAAGIWWATLQVTLAAAGTAIQDVTFRKVVFPFPVQMAQNRIISEVVSVIALLVACIYLGDFNLTHGWTWKIVVLSFWLVVRDWTQMLVVKALSSLWKALASAGALCVTYFLQTIVGMKSLDVVLISFLLCTVLDIIAYALATGAAAAASEKQAAAGPPAAEPKEAGKAYKVEDGNVDEVP